MSSTSKHLPAADHGCGARKAEEAPSQVLDAKRILAGANCFMLDAPVV